MRQIFDLKSAHGDTADKNKVGRQDGKYYAFGDGNWHADKAFRLPVPNV